MKTLVKFCGCTSLDDVMLAAETGADAIGMIFAPSPRRITQRAAGEIAQRLPPFITPVGVFVDPSRQEIENVRGIFPDLVVQLHGDEPPGFVSSLQGEVIKTVHVDPDAPERASLERCAATHPDAILLFDTLHEGKRGGTGGAFPWESITAIARTRKVVVAGGLTPWNVSACIRTVRPFGVDVRSGVETGGRKDRAKMRAFVRAVKDGDAA